MYYSPSVKVTASRIQTATECVDEGLYAIVCTQSNVAVRVPAVSMDTNIRPEPDL